jgi:hypothetical protein
MRPHLALALVASTFTALGGVSISCTAWVASQLPQPEGGIQQTLGDCFDLTPNQCSNCIVGACENASGDPPVSLKQVCTLGSNTVLIETVQQCTADPRKANYECDSMYIDGGTYASSIDTSGAAASNLQHCITDNCRTSCSACNVPVPTCASETVDLVDAGACGACLANAMNLPNSKCQSWVLQGGCYEDSSGEIATCAIQKGQCNSADCSGLQNPSSSLTTQTAGLYQCLWQECSASCPNQ